jgi:hypothetical protein
VNISDFLEARIAEDEALARAALSGIYGEHHDAWDYAGYVLGADRDSTPKQDEFVTAWWPQRALAECAAKWVLVEDWKRVTLEHRRAYLVDPPLAPVVTAFAAVYKDHPDYQREWAGE